MKIISALLLTAVLTSTAGHVLAQATATSRSATGSAMPLPGVKDFKAARELELERNKFQLGTLDKFQKCLDAAKTAANLNACKTARNAALSDNLSELIAQGKFEAAYEKAPRPAEKPTVVPAAPAPAGGNK